MIDDTTRQGVRYPEQLNDLQRVVELHGRPIGVEEVADIVWLAAQIWRSFNTVENISKPESSARDSILSDDTKSSSTENNLKGRKVEAGQQPISRYESAAAVVLPPSTAIEDGETNVPFFVPASSALPRQLDLARSLRPLKQTVSSPTVDEIDEILSAERSSETNTPIVVVRPKRRRWLDVALIIDESPSMAMWHRTIAEFVTLLEQIGAFRAVTSYGLAPKREDEETTLKSLRLHFTMGAGYQDGRLCDPMELVDPRGERVILLLSDTSSFPWYSGEMPDLLELWSNYGPVTILHMLPRNMWEQTTLVNELDVKLSSSAPMVPNGKLQVVEWPWYWEESDFKGVQGKDNAEATPKPIPVITLESYSLGPWANLIAGRSHSRSFGYIFLPSEESENGDGNTSATLMSQAGWHTLARPPIRLSGQEAEEYFDLSWRLLSRPSRELASYLASTPITLEIIRIVQQKIMGKEANQTHVAELFYSGLFCQLTDPKALHSPDEIIYDFYGGKEVRHCWRQIALRSTTVDVFHEISDYIDAVAGRGGGFKAFLYEQELDVDTQLNTLEGVFAQIAPDVLDGLGGFYSEWARRLDTSLEILIEESIRFESSLRIHQPSNKVVTDLLVADLTNLIKQSQVDERQLAQIYSHCLPNHLREKPQFSQSALDSSMQTLFEVEHEQYGVGFGVCVFANVVGQMSLVFMESKEWIDRAISKMAWQFTQVDVEVEANEIVQSIDKQVRSMQSVERKEFSILREGRLQHQEILSLHQALFVLLDQGNASAIIDNLLVGMDPAYRRALPDEGVSQTRLLNILNTVNMTGLLSTGEFPLEILLTNALYQLGNRQESLVVQKLIERVAKIKEHLLEGSVKEAEEPESQQSEEADSSDTVADKPSVEASTPEPEPIIEEPSAEQRGQADGTPLKTILYLASSPKDKDSLRLGEELRKIQTGMSLVGTENDIQIIAIPAAGFTDLRRAMLKYRPSVVHFSGHATEETGIIFETEDGTSAYVDPQGLADFFQPFTDVHCVVLNACYSEPQAYAFAQHIDYVVGVAHAITDDESIEFSVAFYEAISAGNSVDFSFDVARGSLNAVHNVGDLAPTLLRKGDQKVIPPEPGQSLPDIPLEQEPDVEIVTRTGDPSSRDSIDDSEEIDPEANTDNQSLEQIIQPQGQPFLPEYARHRASIWGVAISPDGTLVASASDDGTIKLWDLENQTYMRTFEGHSGRVLRVRFRPNHRQIVSASDDETLRIWDIDSGKCLHVLKGHGRGVSDVAISSSGTQAVSASSDTSLMLWDLENGNCLQTLMEHRDVVTCVALSEDGLRAVSASSLGSLRIWDLTKSKNTNRIRAHTEQIRDIALSADGNLVITACDDETLQVWDLSQRRKIYTLDEHMGTVYGVALSQDEQYVLSASEDGTVKVWDLADGTVVQTLEGDQTNILHLDLSPDKTKLVASTSSGDLLLWQLPILS